MTRTFLPLTVVLCLSACTEEESWEPVGAMFDDASPVGHDVSDRLGVAPASALVRAVNAWGAAVPADDLTVQVGDSERIVLFDGHGYGGAPLDTPGSAEVVAGEATGWVHATANGWDGFAEAAATPGLAGVKDLQPATDGAVALTDEALWWFDVDGTSHSVLSAPAGVVLEGVSTGHLDDDGILDAVILAGDKVLLLRGRYGGGMSWGGGLEASGQVPSAVGAGDLDGDGHPDLAVTWVGDQISWLEVWHGDGLWNFESAQPTRLTITPVSMALGDNSGEGRTQITLMDEGGAWKRYVVSEDTYAVTGPSLELNNPEGTTAVSAGDFNDDGGDEIVLLGPLVQGQDREVIVYDLIGVNIQFLRLTPLSAYTHIADADGDGLIELWMLHGDSDLYTLTWDGAQNTQSKVAGLDTWAPFTTVKTPGDDIPEMVLSGEDWVRWHNGSLEMGDTAEWWAPGQPEAMEEAVDVNSPLVTVELDADPTTTHVAGLWTDGSATHVRVWEIEQGDASTYPQFSVHSSVQISPGGEPLDLASCDGDVFALTDDKLAKVSWTAAGVISVGQTRDIDNGVALDCGPGETGTEVALLRASVIQLRDGGTLNWLGEVGRNGAEDVALVDLGSGGEVVSCDVADCVIERWAYGDQGEQVAVTSSGGGLSVDDGTSTTVLPGGGWLSTHDIDGDGLDDLLANDGDVVVAYRTTGEGFGVPEAFHASRSFDGPVVAAEVTGDGHGDLLGVDGQGQVVLTLWRP